MSKLQCHECKSEDTKVYRTLGKNQYCNVICKHLIYLLHISMEISLGLPGLIQTMHGAAETIGFGIVVKTH